MFLTIAMGTLTKRRAGAAPTPGGLRECLATAALCIIKAKPCLWQCGASFSSTEGESMPRAAKPASWVLVASDGGCPRGGTPRLKREAPK